MHIGIVITTYSANGSRNNMAVKSIRSLIENTHHGHYFAYILDDNSKDGHKDILEKNFQNKANIKLVFRDKNVGCGRQKVDGFDMVLKDNPNVKFLMAADDDMIYQPGWLDFSIGVFNSISDCGVLGLWRHRAHVSLSSFVLQEDKRYRIHNMKDVPGNAMLFLKKDYVNVGGWDDHRRGDDVRFTRKIEKFGKKLYAISPPVLRHEGLNIAEGTPVPYMKEVCDENGCYINLKDIVDGL